MDAFDKFDIDKLLDELELNEDNRTALAPAGASNSTNAKPLHEAQLPTVVNKPINNANFISSIGGIETVKNNSSSSFKNVFSSLNDYVNAGIETKTTPVVEPTANGIVENNGSSSKLFEKQPDNDDEEQNCLLYSGSKNENHNDDESDDVVSDDSGSGGRIVQRPDFHNSSSSDSSSPTSGRSTSSIPSSTEIEYENQTFENNTHSFSEFSEKPQPIEATVDDAPLASHNDVPISTVSDTFSTETINLEEISSLSSIVEITSNYNNMKVGSTIDDRDELPQQRLATDQYIAVNPMDSTNVDDDGVQVAGKKQVVGFESTMDDVSDTELESYLQDLEYEVSEKCGDAGPKPIECDNIISKQEPSPGEGVLVEEEDQLSQASTVEVNDSKLQENDVPIPGTPETPMVGQKSMTECSLKELNQPKAEFEAVVEPVAVSDIVQQDLEMATSANANSQDQKVDKISSSDEALENETNELVKDDTIPVAEEAEAPIQTTLQRPNSLDLTTSNNNGLSDTNQTLASPGHTPPSNPSHPPPVDSETTSSSEDFSASIAIPEEADEETGRKPLETSQETFGGLTTTQLGKIPPYWVPDNITRNCMQCNAKFTMIRRRHHCRACGQLLCSACCCRKTKLEYMGDTEERICVQCDMILSEERQKFTPGGDVAGSANEQTESNNSRQPNPNNPMEYCSVIPPHQQVISATSQTPISVMVPVGVLKREGAPRSGRKDKNVIFSDGIRPGCDLTDLDNNWGDGRSTNSLVSSRKSSNRRVQTPPGSTGNQAFKSGIQLPLVDETNNSYIPKKENALPPIYTQTKTDFKYTDVQNGPELLERLKTETLKFAIQRNFYVYVKIIQLSCCTNKTVINFTTHGMHHVGQDEIIVLLEMNESTYLPKDIFLHFNEIYTDADKGTIVNELGFTTPKMANFLGSKEHGGFLYIRQTFQCLQNIHLPEPPYLIGILIHRWEVPWARLFPIRLMLRLGALYRYYPSPLVSVRERDSVYVEIGQTIINVLADFRTYSFTISSIRGMVIHMEDRKTNVLIPRNRYDQVMKTLNNSSDHILAFGANFSRSADGHLVCVQNTESDSLTYTTQAINIQGQPRRVTGASFLVLNGALKSTSGFSAKCTIVEDGLMVQVLPNKMTEIRENLKSLKDVEIVCGPINADEQQTERVSIKWVENDVNFNIGILSPIDKRPMDGVPCIRVHRGLDFSNNNHMIRWTEVYILKSDDESVQGRDPVDMTKLSEQIARSTCLALLSFLDLLATNGLRKIGLRVTLDPENVCYEAGSKYEKLAPLYMNALDNELVMTLHQHSANSQTDASIMLELIFYILDK